MASLVTSSRAGISSRLYRLFDSETRTPVPGIKVLQFITVFAIGGTERQVVNLVRGLDPCRFDLQMGCLRRCGPFLKELETRRVPVSEYRVNSLYPHRSFRQQLRLAGHLRNQQFRIVHTYDLYPNVFAIPAARVAGVPVIVASIGETGDLSTPMQRRVQRAICRLADMVVVNAEAIRDRLIADGYRPDTLVVIHNGIDLSRFQRKGSAGRLRHELGLPSGAPLVGVLSRLIRLKGIEYFLEAVALVASRVPEARFLVIGDSQLGDEGYRQELERYAVRLGLGQRVLFTGFRLDAPEILSELAVSVLPSLSEGLSNTLLESMAAGVPVVATKVGGNPEAVEDDLVGLLVPPRDPVALARAICRILGDAKLAARYGQAGHQRVVERFSIDQLVRNTERLYLSLLERKQCQTVGEPSRAVSRNTIEE